MVIDSIYYLTYFTLRRRIRRGYEVGCPELKIELSPLVYAVPNGNANGQVLLKKGCGVFYIPLVFAQKKI